jgi:hypothetical protein
MVGVAEEPTSERPDVGHPVRWLREVVSERPDPSNPSTNSGRAVGYPVWEVRAGATGCLDMMKAVLPKGVAVS